MAAVITIFPAWGSIYEKIDFPYWKKKYQPKPNIDHYSTLCKSNNIVMAHVLSSPPPPTASPPVPHPSSPTPAFTPGPAATCTTAGRFKLQRWLDDTPSSDESYGNGTPLSFRDRLLVGVIPQRLSRTVVHLARLPPALHARRRASC